VSRVDLERVLDDVAAALEAAGLPTKREAAAADTVAWSRGGVTFAVLGDAGVELRLDVRVAAAAARTPDAAPSDRGPDWVRFNPHTMDAHAVDRLDAWFGLAARRAEETPPLRDRRS
jgi:hypothetical protein